MAGVLPGYNNKLFARDVRLLSHTSRLHPLLHAGGSISNEIVHTVRVPEGTESMAGMLRNSVRGTVKTFLQTFAVRTTPEYGFDEDAIRGVDWNWNFSKPIGAAADITVPLLTVGMTGHWEASGCEKIYDNAAGSDKSVAFVEGASHVYTPCKECEKTPGQFGDTIKTLYDYVDQWMAKPGRFTSESK